jgi:hypothetical protein
LIRVHVNFTAEAVDDDVLIFPAPLDTLKILRSCVLPRKLWKNESSRRHWCGSVT